MFPYIIKNSCIPSLFSYKGHIMYAIVIYPFIFIINEKNIPSEGAYNYERIINHERIHCEQYKELLIIGFYIIYLLEFIYNLFKYRNVKNAYLNISLEKEAYSNDYNYEYIKNRLKYAWFK